MFPENLDKMMGNQMQDILNYFNFSLPLKFSL